MLLGDLPALRAAELDAALDAAALHDRAFVPDAERTGTVLITARAGISHVPAFGPDSAARHARTGYTRLEVPPDSGLRCDVDTLDSLARLGARVGAHTLSALG